MPKQVTSFPHGNKKLCVHAESVGDVEKETTIGSLDQTVRFTLLIGCFGKCKSFNRTASLIIHESRAVGKTARGVEKEKPLGNDLLSQEVALQVPSALTDLTAGFGM